MNTQLVELKQLTEQNPMDIARLRSVLTEMNTVDIAGFLEDLESIDTEKLVSVFRCLPKSMASEVFSYMDPAQQQIIVEALTDSETGEIINTMFVDDAVDFIEELPANVVKHVLRNVHDEKRKLINQLLKYPDDSAGSIMTTEYVDLTEGMSVGSAFKYIRETGLNKETIYTSYVIKEGRELCGVISAKTLLLASPDEKIGGLMDTNILYVHTQDDQEMVAGLFKKYGLLAMPVVDAETRLVGIITVDDIVEVIEEENTEDFEKMAAIRPSDEPYLKTTIWKHAKNRFVWLLILMLSATITGTIIGSFENALAQMAILTIFIPMLMDTGGNAGAQSSTLIIRGMALGEIEIRDIFKVLWKEVRISILCGLGLGLVNFVRIYFMNGHNVLLSASVTLSLAATIIVAKSVGCMLPMVAKKLKLDPAIMASPIITTLVDTASLIIYFSIAKAVFEI
ncbi:magnesium transporter [Breznakiellaceae bacterium SP9]